MKTRTLIIIASTVFFLNAIYFVYFRFLDTPPEAIASYGEVLAKSSATSHDGAEVDWHRKWALLIYISETAEEALGNARYASMLADRYKDSGLAVVGFVKGNGERAGRVAAENHLRYPVIADPGSDWNERLAVESYGYGVFLLDPMGSVRFSAFRIEPQDIRQLIEVNLTGGVSSAVPSAKISAGDSVPPAEIIELATSKRLSLDELSQPLLVFFAGNCTSCMLENHLAQYADLESRLAGTDQLPALIFSSEFVPGEIRRSTRSLPIEAPIFVAAGTIEGVEDGYFQKSWFEHHAIVLEAQDREVVDVHPLVGFIEHLQGDGRE